MARAAYEVAATLYAMDAGVDAGLILAPCAAHTRGAPRRPRAVTEARGVALYVTTVSLNLGRMSMARAAGVSHAAISQMMGRIEDRRDDPAFDACLHRIELGVIHAAA
jgi:hypothetical protein